MAKVTILQAVAQGDLQLVQTMIQENPRRTGLRDAQYGVGEGKHGLDGFDWMDVQRLMVWSSNLMKRILTL